MAVSPTGAALQYQRTASSPMAWFAAGTVKWSDGMTVEVSVANLRPEVVRFEVTDLDGLSGRRLAALQPARRMALAVELLSSEESYERAVPFPVTRRGDDEGAVPPRAQAAVRRSAQRRAPKPGAPTYGPEDFRSAAEAYTAAQMDGGSTAEAVKRALELGSREVARKVVERCRRLTDPETGETYLPPAGSTRPKAEGT